MFNYMMRKIHMTRRELIQLLLLIVCVTTFRSAIADWNDVPTGSMEPTILVGERIFVNKVAYDLKLPYTRERLATWSKPQRGDIVVLFSPENEKRLVKRIVAVPGDTIALRDNRLYINGIGASYTRAPNDLLSQTKKTGTRKTAYHEHLMEKQHLVMFQSAVAAPRSFGPIIIPNKQYFVMGDNRDLSADSRSFGFVEEGRIVGRVESIVASVDPDRWFMPRFNRWFSSIS